MNTETQTALPYNDGDILKSLYSDTLVIFKSYDDKNKLTFTTYYNTSNFSNKDWFSNNFELASDNDKVDLFKRLNKIGLMWNTNKKQLERYRWRAKINDEYFYFNHKFDIIKEKELGRDFDIQQWDSLNYFQTEEECHFVVNALKTKLITVRKLK